MTRTSTILVVWATILKEVRYGGNVFFNANVHVNHTNICVLACRFCAFRRGPRAQDAYALDVDAYVDAVGEYADLVDEVHTVGGLHPSWSIEHYETMFRRVRAAFPHVHVKALTAVGGRSIWRRCRISRFIRPWNA